MKLFDDIFRENVDKAFSNYNADHLADEGWNSFMADRKRARRLKAVIPLWAKAASIVLIVGAGALIGYLTINRKLAEDTLTASETESKKEIPEKVHSEFAGPVSPSIAETSVPVRESGEVRHIVSLLAAAVSEQPAETDPLHQGVTLAHVDTIVLPLVAENRFLLYEDSINHVFEEGLKKFQEGKSEETVTEEAVKRSGRTTFMAGLTGQMAHVKDVASTAPGVSVGFYLEQKITERISLRPGLALAINSLGVDNRSGYDALAYSVPLIDGNSGTPTSYKGQLRMLAMELPLNIVFKVFNKGRSGIYLSAGASTMIYFSQQFTGDFVNEYTQNKVDAVSGIMTSETRYSTVMVNNSYGTLSRTDFFGLANLSAGYSLPYGKKGTMLIEPFLQLPVSDLTALNLRVRYGGISIKIRFGSQNNEK
jgi:hypothetical protein